MKTENEKCGEIFRCGPGKFIFTCAYCSKNFDSKTIALNHIENHFVIEMVCSTNELEVKTEEFQTYLPPLDELTTINQSINEARMKKAILTKLEIAYELPPTDGQTTNQLFTASPIETPVLTEIKIQPVHESLPLDPLSNRFDDIVFKNEPELIIPNEEVSHLNSKSTQKYCGPKKGSSSSRNKQIVKCDVCGKMLLKNSLYDHMKVHANLKKFQCSNCPQRFNTRSTLCKHTKLHHNQETLKTVNVQNTTISKGVTNKFSLRRKSIVECDICKKKMQRRNVEMHMSDHANLKQFSCSVCQKGFNNQTRLKRHEKTHTGIKEYNCHFCAAQFYLQSNLIAHIRIHTGEKPYKCNNCEEQFTHWSTLRDHQYIHTGKKPYTCELCGKLFRYRSAYKSHLGWHTAEKKYKCDLCANAFGNSKSLREHRRTHTGERPFSCVVCNQSFARQHAYHQHTILHTGEKPYKCRFCDVKFSQGAGRRSHERSVHQDSKKKFTVFGIIEDTT